MSKKIEDVLELFHDYGIYLPSRTIKIFGEITEEKKDQVISNLHALDCSEGTVNILISSEGGSTDDGLAIYDAIKGMKNYVRGMVYGYAESMGATILQACDERFLAPHSRIMIHMGEASSRGHPIDKKRWDEYQDIQEKQLEDTLLNAIKKKHPRYTRKKLQDLMMFDKIILPKEAIELGLADGIEKCWGVK